MNLKALPKVELHLHLDCSLSYNVVQQIDPAISYKSFRESFVAPPKCTDLKDYLTRAVKGYQLMQTEKQIHLVVKDLFQQLEKDAVIYTEIRFAPLQHLEKGLSAKKVVRSVIKAVEEGVERTGVEANIILCTLRHYSEVQSLETITLVDFFKGTRVTGFDIAADEAGYPIDSHIRAFQYAMDNGISCTAHAGEAKGADSVWETLEYFRPSRIGHGVRSTEDSLLIEFLKTKDIHLEVCPTSNVQTNVFPEITDHVVDQLYRAGISLSINTDARTISDVTLYDEYERLEKVFSWTSEHFRKCNLEAVRHAFTSQEVKSRLIKIIMEAYPAHP